MKKNILLALFVFYFMAFNGDGYITDVTSIDPNRAEYTAYDINKADIPQDVMLGCYTFVDNVFVLDEAKRTEIIEAQEPPPEI